MFPTYPNTSCCVPSCAGQSGIAHPQAPNCPKAKMYKVLREISEEISQGQKGESMMSVGGRVRNPQLKAMLAKQLGQSLESLEGAALVDLKTGRITSKKSKKEKSPVQLALDELKKVNAKFLAKTLVHNILRLHISWGYLKWEKISRYFFYHIAYLHIVWIPIPPYLTPYII